MINSFYLTKMLFIYIFQQVISLMLKYQLTKIVRENLYFYLEECLLHFRLEKMNPKY